jgi:hypothetical protein
MSDHRPLFPANLHSNYNKTVLCSILVCYSKGHWLPLNGWIGEHLEAAARIHVKSLGLYPSAPNVRMRESVNS